VAAKAVALKPLLINANVPTRITIPILA